MLETIRTNSRCRSRPLNKHVGPHQRNKRNTKKPSWEPHRNTPKTNKGFVPTRPIANELPQSWSSNQSTTLTTKGDITHRYTATKRTSANIATKKLMPRVGNEVDCGPLTGKQCPWLTSNEEDKNRRYINSEEQACRQNNRKIRTNTIERSTNNKLPSLGLLPKRHKSQKHKI